MVKYVKSSVSLIDYFGSDLSVVNAARVSFAKESHELSEQDEKLIHYLAKHKHKSPFNHAFLSFRVKAPIFVARQLVKHEYLTWNEESRRYVDDEPEFYDFTEWRGRSRDKKQGSRGRILQRDEDVMRHIYNKICDETLSVYKRMLQYDVAPEQARAVLPLSTMTEWIWSGSLGAFAKMLNLRLSHDSQKETQEVARLIKELLEPLFPISLKALTEHPIL